LEHYLGLDVSGIVPTANENRPKNIADPWYIKAFDEAANPGLIDVAALAEEVADLQTQFGNSALASSLNFQKFTASGTFTVPLGVTKIKVTCIGGGASNSAPGEFFANPGDIVTDYFSVSPGAAYAVAVGAAGTASEGGSGFGSTWTTTDGGNSAFGSLLSAAGGGYGHRYAAYGQYYDEGGYTGFNDSYRIRFATPEGRVRINAYGNLGATGAVIVEW
jgi:hypothetical protein